jgi:cytochrome c peroxidase
VVDPGRHAGIAALLASQNNLLGRWADPPAPGSDDPALKTRHVLAQHRNFGEFKVPGLRHVAQTAPYLHDGQKATLGDVIAHYDKLSPDRLHADGEQILKPLQLRGSERADLLAFLRSLDGGVMPDRIAVPAGCR